MPLVAGADLQLVECTDAHFLLESHRDAGHHLHRHLRAQFSRSTLVPICDYIYFIIDKLYFTPPFLFSKPRAPGAEEKVIHITNPKNNAVR